VFTLGADYRTREWKGTKEQIADHSGASRNTVTAALDRLASLGLIQIIEPFGNNRNGIVRVAVYEDLVKPERKRYAHNRAIENAQNCANDEESIRAAFAHESRITRAAVAQIDANAPPLTSEDAGARGSEAVRGRGTREELRGEVGARDVNAVWVFQPFHEWEQQRPFVEDPAVELQELFSHSPDEVTDWGLKVASLRKTAARRQREQQAVS
jgi:hypothetical protein